MKSDVRRILIAMVLPMFLIFILYTIKVLEVGMDWDFTRLGVYPLSKKGMFGIFAHPLIHSGFKHLLANTLPLFFLSWCLFYFYRSIAPLIFFIIWIGCGTITFLIGKPGWHIGASGIIYGLAFSQKVLLPQGFFSFLQRTLTKICPPNRDLSFSNLPLRWTGVEYASLFRTIGYFVGGASEWSCHRYHLCPCFYESWSTKA